MHSLCSASVICYTARHCGLERASFLAIFDGTHEKLFLKLYFKDSYFKFINSKNILAENFRFIAFKSAYDTL